METAPHGLKKRLAALVLSLLLLVTCLPGALAVDLNVDAGFYFKQSRGGTWHAGFGRDDAPPPCLSGRPDRLDRCDRKQREELCLGRRTLPQLQL